MVGKLTLALGLMAVCVALHTAGVTCALGWLRRRAQPAPSLWPGTRWLIGLAAWIILLHLVEIITWGLCYAWTGAMQGVQRALYFSAVTYTTTGYGDLILPEEWRLVGAVEALTGILMCGLSTGFFFAVVSRLYQAYDEIAHTSQSSSRPS
jgi:voltage-gated potassium channel Kch